MKLVSVFVDLRLSEYLLEVNIERGGKRTGNGSKTGSHKARRHELGLLDAGAFEQSSDFSCSKKVKTKNWAKELQ